MRGRALEMSSTEIGMNPVSMTCSQWRPTRWRDGSSRSGVARGKQASKRQFGGSGISHVMRGGGELILLLSVDRALPADPPLLVLDP